MLRLHQNIRLSISYTKANCVCMLGKSVINVSQFGQTENKKNTLTDNYQELVRYGLQIFLQIVTFLV